MKPVLGALCLAGYVAVIPMANWAITTYGVVPVGLGLMAPAGVYFAGLAFTLRDLCQESLGKAATVAAIGFGALLSLAVADPFVAGASAAAFLVSEVCDFVVYSPLRERHWLGAVTASNTVGLVVDSALFLLLAFFDLTFLPGQVLGKVWVTLLALPFLWMLRRMCGFLPRHASPELAG